MRRRLSVNDDCFDARYSGLRFVHANTDRMRPSKRQTVQAFKQAARRARRQDNISPPYLSDHCGIQVYCR